MYLDILCVQAGVQVKAWNQVWVSFSVALLLAFWDSVSLNLEFWWGRKAGQQIQTSSHPCCLSIEIRGELIFMWIMEIPPQTHILKFQELFLILNLVCLCVWCVYTCVCRCVHLCACRERAEEGFWSLPGSFTLYFLRQGFSPYLKSFFWLASELLCYSWVSPPILLL